MPRRIEEAPQAAERAGRDDEAHEVIRLEHRGPLRQRRVAGTTDLYDLDLAGDVQLGDSPASEIAGNERADEHRLAVAEGQLRLQPPVMEEVVHVVDVSLDGTDGRNAELGVDRRSSRVAETAEHSRDTVEVPGGARRDDVGTVARAEGDERFGVGDAGFLQHQARAATARDEPSLEASGQAVLGALVRIEEGDAVSFRFEPGRESRAGPAA